MRGKDIKRYGYDFADLWLIAIPSGYTNKNRGKEYPEQWFKTNYKFIYKHFLKISNQPTKGNGLFNRDDQGDYWWELRSC